MQSKMQQSITSSRKSNVRFLNYYAKFKVLHKIKSHHQTNIHIKLLIGLLGFSFVYMVLFSLVSQITSNNYLLYLSENQILLNFRPQAQSATYDLSAVSSAFEGLPPYTHTHTHTHTDTHTHLHTNTHAYTPPHTPHIQTHTHITTHNHTTTHKHTNTQPHKTAMRQGRAGTRARRVRVGWDFLGQCAFESGFCCARRIQLYKIKK